MLRVGAMNTLEVYKFVDFGVYLDGEQYGPILLPKRYVPEGVEEGTEIEVFIYLDSEDRLVATTETPKIMVGQIAFLQVKQVNNVGAFLDWGLMKDLFVPFREQKVPMEEGRWYWVTAYVDPTTERIVGTARIEHYMSEDLPVYFAGDEVTIGIYTKTDLGYKVIVDQKFWGLLYANEIFEELRIGEQRQAYIKKIRDDVKIDVSLQKIGFKRVDDVQGLILTALEKNNNFLALHDKSSAEEISRILGMSKKSFKMGVGMLYKAQKITLEHNGIRLL